MKAKKQILIGFVVLIGTLLLSACGSTLNATSWPGLTYDQDNVYVAYLDKVYAVEISDGTLEWTFPDDDSKLVVYAPPFIYDNQIIVGDFSNTLYSLDIEDEGDQNWSFSEAKGRYIGAAYAENDIILVPNADKNLYALDLEGELLWKFETEHSLWSQPIVDGDVVYLAAMDHNLYALSLQDGEIMWKLDLGAAIVSSPVLDENGVLYVTTLGNALKAVRVDDQRVLWTFETEKEIWATPFLYEGKVYFGDLSGMIYAVDSENGTLEWDYKLEGGIVGAAGGNEKGVVFSSETGEVVLLDYSGDNIWDENVDAKLYSPVIVTEDTILLGVTQGDNILLAFDFDGDIVWRFSKPE